MPPPLVVGVDGSEPGMRAVDWAADEAALRGLPLRLVYADLWERYEGRAIAGELARSPEEIRANDIVEGAERRARARHPELTVESEVLPEEPEYALVREARDAAVVVVGTRGRSGVAELLLGSVSLHVAAHADCPVVVLRGSHDNQAVPGTHGRILLAVGDEGKESPAVRFAYEEARRRRVPLEAVRVWRHPAHETTDHPLLAGEPARLHEEKAVEILEAALAGAPGDVEVVRRTVEGHARRALVDLSHGADLLVVGAERRDATFGLQLGRVAHAVLHHSACPVAVVPHRV
jgi:nucleotide-binding universal stress UspA family protein